MAKVKTKNCRCCEGSGREIDHFAVGMDLRAIREKAGKSLTFVADDMGISKAYLHDLEFGKRYWNRKLINQYQAAL